MAKETPMNMVAAPARERVAELNHNAIDSLRLALRRVASTVYVVAVNDGDAFFATTATAVTSVSFDPPTVLVCLNRASTIAAAIERSDVFSLNVLRADQARQSQTCAGGASHEERKELFASSGGDHDAALLRDAQASLICRKSMALQCGTHLIVLGEVVEAFHDADVNPLVYLDGKYGAFAATNAW
jgi:flavin reductase (DIM6/NTAB) family NADH-FMN oxidoreductase RutF